MTIQNETTNTAVSRVHQVVAGIRNLPTPPMVFSEIQRVINRESASAADVAEILAEDPSMSAKVLKMTNSAFFGLSREIDSVKQAVMVIGFDAVRNLVLSASVMEMFKGNEVDNSFQERYWRHSLATAQGSRLIARKVRAIASFDVESTFSAGLLHDIGKLVIATFMRDDFKAMNALSKERPEMPDMAVEKEVLNFSHVELGVALGETWNLSAALVDAMALHHNPPEDNPASLAYPIHVANYLAKLAFPDDHPEFRVESPNPLVLEKLGLGEDSLDELRNQVLEEYVHAQTFLSMAGN